MTKIVDTDKVQEALNRAAHRARRGPPSSRAGRFDCDNAALRKVTAHDLRRILREQGFESREARGSHEIWHNPVAHKSVVVPTTGTSRRIANALLTHAGLPKAF